MLQLKLTEKKKKKKQLVFFLLFISFSLLNCSVPFVGKDFGFKFRDSIIDYYFLLFFLFVFFIRL